LTKYIAKYVSKKEQNGTIKGAIWGRSKGLDSVDYFSIDADGATTHRIQSLIEQKKVEQKDTDFCTVIDLKLIEVKSIMSPLVRELYELWRWLLYVHLFRSPNDLVEEVVVAILTATEL